jgi:hypothetical protein
MGEKMNVYMILVGMPEGQSPLGGPRGGLVDYIIKDLRDRML